LKILGIDPGLRVTGYGVIRVDGQFPSKIDLLEAGIVRTDEKDGIAGRLKKIHRCLTELVVEHKPDTIAIEKLYAHYDHPATAILMGHARGVVCLLAGEHGLPVVNIASTHVKKAVTGHGHAKKGQIQRMIQHALSLKQLPEPPDVADALAVALAAAQQLRSEARGGKREAGSERREARKKYAGSYA
jgi:crossover junction endodeoxyribonuclease RuvC